MSEAKAARIFGLSLGAIFTVVMVLNAFASAERSAESATPQPGLVTTK